MDKNPGQSIFELLILFVEIAIWVYLLYEDLHEMLFENQCLLPKPDCNETLNMDTNLLGELLTLQGVFQDSNCDSLSCFVGKFELADVVKNGAKADTFSDATKIKLLFDSGTSKTLTAHKEDFLRMTPLQQAKPIQGIGSTVTPKGEGVVRYVLQDKQGEPVTLECSAYYVPEMTPEVRLSVSTWTQDLRRTSWLLC